ncbi:exported hypothetical protein [Vibrio crassostreae]|nr:exported hypothetical protein [Vibrio crassostreae]CAK3187171.1 exported hypothetical protein [Vibrio crassostreae]
MISKVVVPILLGLPLCACSGVCSSIEPIGSGSRPMEFDAPKATHRVAAKEEPLSFSAGLRCNVTKVLGLSATTGGEMDTEKYTMSLDSGALGVIFRF